MSISLNGLTKRYGATTAVAEVSAEIPHGSLTAILGPSGSGKSTLLKLISGLEEPDAGRVVIDGEDVTDVDPRHRDIGFCFQNYAPFRHMNVAKNVGFGLKVRKRSAAEITARVTELLALVKLEDKADRYPSQLSGGERQRMALARALAIEPRVLLLDEPFGALDAVVRQELRQWVKVLHEQIHVTTVLVTHDQQEAMEVADQLIVMRSGHVIQSGNPLALYESPSTDFVHEFLGPSTVFEGVVTRPHDLELVSVYDGTMKGRITSIVSLGFEAQVTVELDDHSTTWVQLSRNELSQMGLRVALLVGVRRRADLDV
ncbi:MAG TPA: sulfate ABC transporter ATP-binding protein [Acidimicrobiales bacterium]|nr:sulfate ABC transporter ATP-binding protein [Acidimicrobiales bacterium]